MGLGTKFWWGNEEKRLSRAGWAVADTQLCKDDKGLFLLVPKAVGKVSREDQLMK